jgi:uncharacterized protein
MMKKNLLRLAFIVNSFLFLIPGYSQQPQSSLLWKISGNGVSGESYLFGTIHALPASRFILNDIYKSRLETTESLVLEIDMSDPKMMGEIQNEMVMKHQKIDSLLSKEDYRIVSGFFNDSLSIPLMMVNRVKPIFLSSFILQKYLGKNPASYETAFLKIAQDAHKQVFGLETIKEQVSYIDKISLKDQSDILLESVKDYEKQKKEYFDLVDVYLSGDIDKIYSLMKETSSEFKEFGTILIDDRNKKWAELIPLMIKKSSCFIAVGSGHLGGENGLIRLLKTKGYTVEPVN